MLAVIGEAFVASWALIVRIIIFSEQQNDSSDGISWRERAHAMCRAWHGRRVFADVSPTASLKTMDLPLPPGRLCTSSRIGKCRDEI